MRIIWAKLKVSSTKNHTHWIDTPKMLLLDPTIVSNDSIYTENIMPGFCFADELLLKAGWDRELNPTFSEKKPFYNGTSNRKVCYNILTYYCSGIFQTQLLIDGKPTVVEVMACCYQLTVFILIMKIYVATWRPQATMCLCLVQHQWDTIMGWFRFACFSYCIFYNIYRWFCFVVLCFVVVIVLFLLEACVLFARILQGLSTSIWIIVWLRSYPEWCW